MSSPPPPEVWVFQGIEIRAKVGCVNDPSVEAHHRWIRKGEGYEAERQALREELRQRHGALAQISTFQVTVDQPRAIALVRKTLRCTQWTGPPKTVLSYRWHAGADQESLLRQVAADARTSTDVLSFEVVRWVDVAGELGKLATEQEYLDSVTRTFGPLEVSFTSGRTRSGRTVVYIRAVNTDPHRAALIQLTSGNAALHQPVLLQPREQFSGPIEAADSFGVQIQMKEPGDTETQVIDLLKSLMREQIQIRDGKLKPVRPDAVGTRG